MRILPLSFVTVCCLFLTACWDFGSQTQVLEPAAPDEGLYPLNLTIESEGSIFSVCTRFGSNDYRCDALSLKNGETETETADYRIAAYDLPRDDAYPNAATHMFIVANIEPESSSSNDIKYLYYVGAGYVVDGETILFSLDLEDMEEVKVDSIDELVSQATDLALERYQMIDVNGHLKNEIFFRKSIAGDRIAMEMQLRRSQNLTAMKQAVGQ